MILADIIWIGILGGFTLGLSQFVAEIYVKPFLIKWKKKHLDDPKGFTEDLTKFMEKIK